MGWHRTRGHRPFTQENSMKLVNASGSCENCGQFTRVTAKDSADAIILVNHEHGLEYNCAFEGVIKSVPALEKDYEKTPVSKVQKRRR